MTFSRFFVVVQSRCRGRPRDPEGVVQKRKKKVIFYTIPIHRHFMYISLKYVWTMCSTGREMIGPSLTTTTTIIIIIIIIIIITIIHLSFIIIIILIIIIVIVITIIIIIIIIIYHHHYYYHCCSCNVLPLPHVRGLAVRLGVKAGGGVAEQYGSGG